MSKSVQTKFNQATEHFKTSGLVNKVDEGQRKFLYGLSKQAGSGDVTGDRPPEGDDNKRWKYEAWSMCLGMSKQDAMMAFVVEVRKLDPDFNLDGLFEEEENKSNLGGTPKSQSSAISPSRPELASSPSAPNSGKQEGTKVRRGSSKSSSRPSSSRANGYLGGLVIKEGELFKQRDVFKGWRSRIFVLQGTFLHYYMSKDDVAPKKTMEVVGCTIIDLGKTVVGDLTLYPFVISHPKSNKSYNLASESHEETMEWIAKIQAASEKTMSDSEGSERGGYVGRLLDRRPAKAIADDDKTDEEKQIASQIAPVDPELTLKDIPSKYTFKIDMAVESLLDAVSETTTMDWQFSFSKSGVDVYRVGGSSGSTVCVRGETTVPYPMIEVFGTLMNRSTIKDLNPQIASVKELKKYSDNTFVDYIKCKQVWPTAVRDYTNMIHWRLMKDGKIVVTTFSEKFDDLAPLDERNVRAEIILGGYVIVPTEDGTKVHYVLQSDLKGNIPRRISQMVANQQPLLLANMIKIIETNHTKLSLMNHELPVNPRAPVNYDNILHAKQNPLEFGEEGDEEKIKTMPKAEKQTRSGNRRGSILPMLSPGKQSKGSNSVNDSNNSGDANNTKLNENEPKTVTLMTLMTLFNPVLAWYVSPEDYSTLIFFLVLVYSLHYVFRTHLGTPKAVSLQARRSRLASGNLLVRIPIELAKLSRYMKTKREETDAEVTLMHVAIKAAALSIKDTPALNGHFLLGGFFESNAPGVDISVTSENADRETVTLKIDDAERKPVDYIANEVRKMREGEEASWHKRNSALRQFFPHFIQVKIDQLFDFLGDGLGINLPMFGVQAFPYGVCTVVSAALVRDGDSDVDLCLAPNFTSISAPVFITIGGVRMQAGIDGQGNEKRTVISPVLNVSISINTDACSLSECRKFTSCFQAYMNDPQRMDKAERRIVQAMKEARGES